MKFNFFIWLRFSLILYKKNPYIKIDGRPEIVFAGLRNPWAFSFDLDTGDAFIPDIGSEYIEELNIVSYSEFNSFFVLTGYEFL